MTDAAASASSSCRLRRCVLACAIECGVIRSCMMRVWSCVRLSGIAASAAAIDSVISSCIGSSSSSGCISSCIGSCIGSAQAAEERVHDVQVSHDFTAGVQREAQVFLFGFSMGGHMALQMAGKP